MGEFNPPPRWLRCPRRGNLIAEKFLPFKTPLDSKYKNTVEPQYMFTPDMLYRFLQSSNIKMGLWIDLTNTSRFYNKDEIEAYKINYVKIQCRGHGACPSPEQTLAFIKLCENFINHEPKSIIGVHCTHGYNRTGFLICAYLIEKYDWSVDAALNAFAQSRAPGIYKKDYINELYKRYGDPDDAPEAPVLPEWCFDEGDGNDGEENGDQPKSEQNSYIKRKREIFKPNARFMEGISGVITVQDPAKVSQIQRRVQEMCKWTGSGFPGSQPVSLDNYNIKFLSEKQYKVSWKADGTRYLMLIDGEDEIYFIDRDNSVFKASNVIFPKRKAPHEHISNTLVDGEMIIDLVNGISYPKFLIYDIVQYDQWYVGDRDFNMRMQCIDVDIIGPRELAKQERRIDGSKCPFSIRKKEFWDIHYSRSLLGEKFMKVLGHEVDGLIFQPLDKYKPGRCLEVLKWKPHTHNSIDFRLKIVTQQKPGMLRETLGFLFVGKFDQPFATMKANKELKQYDNKIIECTWDYEQNRWKFMRERTDKSYPNAFDTASNVWETIKNPITAEKLLDFIDRYGFYLRKPSSSSSSSSSTASSSEASRSSNYNSDRNLMPPPSKIPKR